MDALILRSLNHGPATISEIAERCGTSAYVVRTRLTCLAKAGFGFTSHPIHGITISQTPDRIDGGIIHSLIPEDKAPRSISVHGSTTSTNDLAHQAGRTGKPNPSVFIAEEQTGGRGRSGRVWASKDGLGLWMSILHSPTQPFHLWPRLTTAVAVLVAKSLRSHLGLPICIKWPNDLWISHSKCAGIIAETGNFQGDPYAVIGIGINVLHTSEDFPLDLRSIATSLRINLPDRVLCRNAIAADLLTAISGIDESISDHGFASILSEARQLSCVLKKTIELDLNGERINGVALDLDPEGHLIVKTDNGVERIFHSGEVTCIRTRSSDGTSCT